MAINHNPGRESRQLSFCGGCRRYRLPHVALLGFESMHRYLVNNQELEIARVREREPGRFILAGEVSGYVDLRP